VVHLEDFALVQVQWRRTNGKDAKERGGSRLDRSKTSNLVPGGSSERVPQAAAGI